MAYIYPDKDDRLTCELITTEYDDGYWGLSEERVLTMAKDTFMEVKLRKPAGENLSLLDLGCGMGRLLELFSNYAGHITAVEPDINRFRHAKAEGERIQRKKETDIRVLHGDASILGAEETYDIIVSSHVLQHIKRDMAQELLETMASKLDEDGVLVVTTTYTAGEEDAFFCESWCEGERLSQEITGETFDNIFGEDGVLPVRMYAENVLLTMAKKAGLNLVRSAKYHYKNHTSVEEDWEANLRGDGTGARDAFYIFRKSSGQSREQEVKIDGNICYHFSFSIFDEEVGLRLDDEQELRAAIRKAYPTAVFHDEERAQEELLFRDLKIGQDFLHGGGLPFHCFRVLIKDYDLKFHLETHSVKGGSRNRDFDILSSHVFMTVFPESDTVQVCICLDIKEAGIQDYVYLRHVQGNGAKLTNMDGRMLSIRDIFDEVSQCLGRNISDVMETYLLEIKKFGDIHDVNWLMENQAKTLYGLMTGDEGWKYVPEELAKARLENSWGSRSFMKLISFGSNSVFLNFNRDRECRDYQKNRMEFDHTYYGDMNPYFEQDSEIAGINHGIIFSMELVLVIKTICNRILRRQASYYIGGQSNKMQAEIRKLKAYRGELITTLNKVENLSISEIGEMERVLLVSQQIEPIIDKIKYLLELLESELDLIYSTKTNRIATALTVGGLIFAGIQILLAL